MKRMSVRAYCSPTLAPDAGSHAKVKIYHRSRNNRDVLTDDLFPRCQVNGNSLQKRHVRLAGERRHRERVDAR